VLEQQEWMVPLIGFFDESENPEGQKPIAVAGFLFTRTGYAQFYRGWKKTVLRHGTKRFAHFHMTDLYAGKGVYAGVTIPERVELFENAITAISKNIYASIGVHFNQQEFEEVAPVEWSRSFGSIYTAACHMSIQATAYGLREWRSSEKVHYTFESGHKFRAQANSLMEKIRNDAEAVRTFRYRGHSFEQKDQSFGLQAADLFAWNVVKESFRTVPPSLRPFLLSMGRLASEIKKRQVFFPLTGEPRASRLAAGSRSPPTSMNSGTWR
jgi:hypothetical protein